MNTTERIVEAVKKDEIIEDCINGRLSIAIAYCNLEDAIASVIGQERWISVEERLPTIEDVDKKGNVLGWDKIQKETHKCRFHDIYDMKLRFTHWQPLPAPPLSDLTPPKTKEDGE